jgi:hypothetical protein
MDASVRAIDAGLVELGQATTAMGEDITSLTATSAASAATMDQLAGDIGFISQSMVDLAAATEQLTSQMAQIEAKAGAIADDGTAQALDTTKDLNGSLPDGVPVPSTSDGEPYDVAMQRLATAQGGGGVAFQ